MSNINEIVDKLNKLHSVLYGNPVMKEKDLRDFGIQAQSDWVDIRNALAERDKLNEAFNRVEFEVFSQRSILDAAKEEADGKA